MAEGIHGLEVGKEETKESSLSFVFFFPASIYPPYFGLLPCSRRRIRKPVVDKDSTLTALGHAKDDHFNRFEPFPFFPLFFFLLSLAIP
jgi:hypothetical protein